MENNNNTVKIETWAPVFSGFYNTVWEMEDDYIYEDYKQEFDLYVTYDDFQWDYKQYEKDVCVEFVSVLKEKVQ